MKRICGTVIGGWIMLAAAGSAGAYTEYTWRGSNSTDWADVNNWQAPNGMAPTGGTYDARVSVYNAHRSPLFHTVAQGETVLAATGAGAPRAIVVGSSETGTLVVTGGKLELRGVQPDVVGNSTLPGTVIVDGGTLFKTNASEFFLGLGGAGGWGALVVSNGTATLRSITNATSGSTITLAGGTLEMGRFRRSATFTNYFNGGTLKAMTNESSWIQSGTVNLVGGSGLTVDTVGYDVVLLSSLSSNAPAAGLVKKGSGILTLQAPNTYTGPTRVEVGRLILRDDNALAGTSSIVVSNDTYLGVGSGVSAGAGRTAVLYGRYLGDNSGALRVRDGSGTL